MIDQITMPLLFLSSWTHTYCIAHAQPLVVYSRYTIVKTGMYNNESFLLDRYITNTTVFLNADTPLNAVGLGVGLTFGILFIIVIVVLIIIFICWYRYVYVYSRNQYECADI